MILTENQIDEIVEWMNGWEQLKNTSIPIRFREQFSLKPDESFDRWLNLHYRIAHPELGGTLYIHRNSSFSAKYTKDQLFKVWGEHVISLTSR